MQVREGGRRSRPVPKGIAVFALLVFSSVCLSQSNPEAGGEAAQSHALSSAAAEGRASHAAPGAPAISNGAARTRPSAFRAAQAQPAARFASLPLSFEANRGQAAAPVEYLTRGAGYTLYLTPQEAVLALRAAERRASGRSPRTATIRMRLEGARRGAALEGVDPLPGQANYFIGSDSRAWRTHIPTYAQVAYRNVYSGVDLVYYGRSGQLEYDFRLNPGAKARSIRLALAGADGASLTPGGDLALKVAGGETLFRKPVAYQADSAGGKHYIAAAYRLEGTGKTRGPRRLEIGFRVGAFDHNRALVIDPALNFSTYLGGSGADSAAGVAVDASGDAYITGQTTSVDFPAAGGEQTANAGGMDAFVTKISSDGKSLLYSTYLGGSGTDAGAAIAVDASGEAFVTGNTSSTDFPTTAGSRQTANAGGVDAFVTRLDSSGATRVYSA